MATHTKEELIKAAWDRWFEADYSWDGLKGGLFGQALQNYWLSDPHTGEPRSKAVLKKAGELIECKGQKSYHMAHLPLYYQDGTPTIKTVNQDFASQLNQILRQRLEFAHNRWNRLSSDGRTAEGYLTMARFDGVVFLGISFNELLGEDCVVNAEFSMGIFSDIANFNFSKFVQDVNFLRVVFVKECSFGNAQFMGNANFEFAEFCGNASFRSTSFAKLVSFTRSNFWNNANFSKSSFDKDAVFEGTIFGSTMNFYSAIFSKIGSFTSVEWPNASVFHDSAFENVQFTGLAAFNRSGFKAYSAFNGARFQQTLSFDYPKSESAADKQFRIELNAAINNGANSENSLAALEGGCRNLKQEMEKISDKSREHIFYKFEVMARRERASTPLAEKIASYAYGWVSDFGLSILRPIAWLGIIWIIFAIQFASYNNIMPLDLTQDPELTHHNLAEIAKALTVSASRLFPFGAFEMVSRDFAAQLSTTHAPLTVLGFRILASFESLFAIILVFLFGLAIRRRFQLS